MTELKYLEEVLPAYRAGKTIGRIIKNGDPIYYSKSHNRLSMLINYDSLDSPVWFVKPELVSWHEAWEALKDGKKVKVDDIVYYARIHLPGGTVKKQLCFYYKDPENFGNEAYFGCRIPIEWLDRNDFEVLE